MPTKIEKDDVIDIVKQVYNDHLAYTKSFYRKPFRIRKNFKKFKEDSRYQYYHRLALWFKKHPEINRKLYFEGTLYFNRGSDVVHIKQYCLPKSLTSYTRYRKLLQSLDLDNPKSLELCIESFKFIKTFCEDVGIKPSDYLDHKEIENGSNSYLKHLKKGSVNIYSLFAYSSFFNILSSLYKDRECWDFYIGDSNGDFTPFFFLKRWEASHKFSTLANKAKQTIIKQTNTI